MSFGGEIGSCSVAEVMGTEMFTVTPETAVSSARRLVLENDVHHMLVLENGTLAGIVCRDDLRFADRDARIGECMTSPVLCITPDTTLQEAVDIMGANDIDCLPVVTGAFLVGIVTLEALSTANLYPNLPDDTDLDLDLQSVSGPADDFEASVDTEVADSRAPSATVPAESCGACGSRHQVTGAEKGPRIALCHRCRRLLAANQQC